jgi:hypothetical protein
LRQVRGLAPLGERVGRPPAGEKPANEDIEKESFLSYNRWCRRLEGCNNSEEFKNTRMKIMNYFAYAGVHCGIDCSALDVRMTVPFIR